MSQAIGPTFTNQPTILVLSDNSFLFDLVRANLQPLPVRVQRVEPPGLPLAAPSHCDLIIIANSVSTSEPVVILAETALANQIGRTPMLIISDRVFEPCPDRLIFHLDFPFNATILRRQVMTLLPDVNWPASLGISH